MAEVIQFRVMSFLKYPLAQIPAVTQKKVHFYKIVRNLIYLQSENEDEESENDEEDGNAGVNCPG